MVEQHHRFNSLLCPSPLSSVITKKNEEKKGNYTRVYFEDMSLAVITKASWILCLSL